MSPNVPFEVPAEQEFRDWDEGQVLSYFEQFTWFREETRAAILESCLSGTALLNIKQDVLSTLIPMGTTVCILKEVDEIRSKGKYG
jgi:hypothetical protein